jgi:hypothetical protein
MKAPACAPSAKGTALELRFSLRTSQNSVNAKFAEFTSLLKNTLRIEGCAGAIPQGSLT